MVRSVQSQPNDYHLFSMARVLGGAGPRGAAPSPDLALRDAIDYVHWILHATLKYYKFVEGPAICGGKAEIACVTTDRGFRWVTHKSLDW